MPHSEPGVGWLAKAVKAFKDWLKKIKEKLIRRK
jgi:hypothetical protein